MSDPLHKSGLFWKLQSLLRRKEAESVRDRVEELIERGEENGKDDKSDDDLDTHERALLSNVLRLQGTTAYDVMVPRADIMAMPEDLTLEQAIQLIQKDGHSRYPIYRESLDDIVGMVHIKDVFASVGQPEPFDLKAVLRKPLFVVPSIPVLDLLLQMRQQRTHMALVVDEYGGIDGLITIEDLVETIVGDISDEHDDDEDPLWLEEAPGTYLAQARMDLDEAERAAGVSLIDPALAEEVDTLGGLVIRLAGRLPARGEVVPHPAGHEFEVVDGDARRLGRVRVRLAQARPAEAAE